MYIEEQSLFDGRFHVNFSLMRGKLCMVRNIVVIISLDAYCVQPFVICSNYCCITVGNQLCLYS